MEVIGGTPMSDVEALLAAFESGELLRPDPDVPNFLDLSRAVGAACGVRGLTLSGSAQAIAERLEEREHTVFVLADGLGLDMIEQGGDGVNALRAHLAMELRAIFPASTVVALTTLMTGEWPARHAVTGWWTHLEAIGGPATVLPYVRRRDDRSLADLGVRPEDLFPLPALTPRMTRDTLVLVPQAIAGSVYSRYGAGGEPATGYETLAEGVQRTIEAVLGADGPCFVYLYIPHLDQAAHEFGPWSAEATQALHGVNQVFGALAQALRGQAVLALSADHGHLGVNDDEVLLIREDDGLPELLAAEPAGDSRVLHFHVRPGAHEAFATRFRELFSEAFLLLTTQEVDELRLLGAEPLSELTAARLGDFVAISRGAQVLGYHPANGARELLRHASHHSGLRPEELRIPLLLAS
ncbi:MAG: alkaline phosphatase family protein [Chloroflexi bacterium]|nr:alkaline phosphatase family protein [Chloroflexota bacterium]